MHKAARDMATLLNQIISDMDAKMTATVYVTDNDEGSAGRAYT